MALLKKNKRSTQNYREFKEVFSRIENLTALTNQRDLDTAAGILIGMALAKAQSGKITKRQFKTLGELIEGEWNRANAIFEAREKREKESGIQEESEGQITYYDFPQAEQE